MFRSDKFPAVARKRFAAALITIVLSITPNVGIWEPEPAMAAAPTLTSATFGADGVTLTLVFDQQVKPYNPQDDFFWDASTGNLAGAPVVEIFDDGSLSILRDGSPFLVGDAAFGVRVFTSDVLSLTPTGADGQGFSNTWVYSIDPGEFKALEISSDPKDWGVIKFYQPGGQGPWNQFRLFANSSKEVVPDDGDTAFTSVNNSTQPIPAPSVSDASINSAGDAVTIEFDQDVSVTGDGGTWRFLVDGVNLESVGTPVSASGSSPNNEWVFSLPQFVRKNQDIIIRHTGAAGFNMTNGSSRVADIDGTPSEIGTSSLSGFNTSSTPADASNPTIDSAELGSDGKTITVTFSEEMHNDSSVSGFAVTVDGSQATIQSVSNIGFYEESLTITLQDEVTSAATVTLDYDATTGDLKDIVDKPLQTLSAAFSVTNNSGVAPTSSEAPGPPYTGPLIEGVKDNGSSQFSASGTETAVFEGERLGTITKAFINGIEAEVLSTSNDEFEVSIPEGLEPGTYDLEITSSAGNLTYLDAITIVGTTSVETTSYGEVTAWTSRISDTQVKVYVKFPTVGEKVRISHQTGGSGSYESVYVKTTSSETMEGLRIVEGVGTYVVRTIDLSDINRIRVTVGDEELVQVRYNN
jgi:hypothetical protein